LHQKDTFVLQAEKRLQTPFVSHCTY